MTVFMEKTNLTIQLDCLELIAATKELLQAEADHPELGQHLRAEVPDKLAHPTVRQRCPAALPSCREREPRCGRMDGMVHPATR